MLTFTWNDGRQLAVSTGLEQPIEIPLMRSKMFFGLPLRGKFITDFRDLEIFRCVFVPTAFNHAANGHYDRYVPQVYLLKSDKNGEFAEKTTQQLLDEGFLRVECEMVNGRPVPVNISNIVTAGNDEVVQEIALRRFKDPEQRRIHEVDLAGMLKRAHIGYYHLGG